MNVIDRFVAETRHLGRTDLYVCDIEPLDSNKVATLVAHDAALGTPSAGDVYKWAQTTFGGAVMPQIATLKAYPYENCVSVVLAKNLQQRPAADRSGMRAVTANLYSEDSAGQLWSLVTANDGTQYLVRNTEENVADIVAQAKRANYMNHSLRLSSMKSAAPMVDKGDHVKFFGPMNEVLYGTVSSVSGEMVTVQTQHDGQAHTVSRYAITDIIKKSQDAQDRVRAEQQAFFATIYGSEEFAQKLTQRDVNEGGLYPTSPAFSK